MEPWINGFHIILLNKKTSLLLWSSISHQVLMHMNKIPLSLLLSRLSYSTSSASPHMKGAPDPQPSSHAALALHRVHIPIMNIIQSNPCYTVEPKTVSCPCCQHSYWCSQWDCLSWQCGMLLDPGQLAIQQDHQVPSVQPISSQLGSRVNLVQGLVQSLHEIRIHPILYFVEFCLNRDIPICCINYSSHIYIISELCSPDPFLSPGVYHWWLGFSWELCPVFQFTSLLFI